MTKLRIVAGEFGGRRIDAPSGRGTRPTREKVREAWFSALGPGIAGSEVADLFAGSGALGLEALSRGAASVTFVESDGRAAGVLARNLEALGVGDRCRLLRRDVGDALGGWRERGRVFDLVLADPPYESDWAWRLGAELRREAFARLLCIEHRPGALDGMEGVVWSRGYGDSGLTFLRPPASAGGRRGETASSKRDQDEPEGEG